MNSDQAGRLNGIRNRLYAKKNPRNIRNPIRYLNDEMISVLDIQSTNLGPGILNPGSQRTRICQTKSDQNNPDPLYCIRNFQIDERIERLPNKVYLSQSNLSNIGIKSIG